MVGVTPQSFLDHFGRGLGGTISFGHSGFNVGWAKAPIGHMFDLLRLDKGQRKELWAVIGPNTPFHRTQKDATWGCWPVDTRTHKTPYQLFQLLCGMGALQDTLGDAIELGDGVRSDVERLQRRRLHASDGVRDRPIGSIWLPALHTTTSNCCSRTFCSGTAFDDAACTRWICPGQHFRKRGSYLAPVL